MGRGLLFLAALATSTLSSVTGKRCDYKVGTWVPNPPRPGLYSGSSCPDIWKGYNCLQNGRRDTRYLNYRWKPAECDLPYFSPEHFLMRMRNKSMAIIGDSVAKDFAEALLCLIHSQYPTKPAVKLMGRNVFYGSVVPQFNVFITNPFQPYLVRYSRNASSFLRYKVPYPGANSRSAVIWVDKVDPDWGASINFFDVLVMESGFWWEGPALTVMRGIPVNLPYLVPLRLAIQTVTSFVHRSDFRGMALWLTFSPSHYVHLQCTRLAPFGPVAAAAEMAKWRTMISHEAAALRKSNFQIVNITALSAARPDAHVAQYHPGDHFDCLHWCLPGVPDTWVDLFWQVLLGLY